MNRPLSARALLLGGAMLASLPTIAAAQDADPNRKIGLVGLGIAVGGVSNGTAYENVSAGSLALRVSGGGQRVRLAINVDVAAGLVDHDVVLNGPGATGTINMILITNAALSASAMVTLVQVATESKTAALLAHGVKTWTGQPGATGTGTDAVVVIGEGGQHRQRRYTMTALIGDPSR